jgi:hypothetical protein
LMIWFIGRGDSVSPLLTDGVIGLFSETLRKLLQTRTSIPEPPP